MFSCWPQVDVFSFGIVLWELLTGEEPYADLHYGVIIGGYKSNISDIRNAVCVVRVRSKLLFGLQVAL